MDQISGMHSRILSSPDSIWYIHTARWQVCTFRYPLMALNQTSWGLHVYESVQYWEKWVHLCKYLAVGNNCVVSAVLINIECILFKIDECCCQGADSIRICHRTSIGNPIVEKRRSYDRLISTMGFPILARWHLYIESGPRSVLELGWSSLHHSALFQLFKENYCVKY